MNSIFEAAFSFDGNANFLNIATERNYSSRANSSFQVGGNAEFSGRKQNRTGKPHEAEALADTPRFLLIRFPKL